MRRVLEAGLPEALRQRHVLHHLAQRAPPARPGAARTTLPLTPSWTSSAGPPLSTHVITGLRDENASTVTKP